MINFENPSDNINPIDLYNEAFGDTSEVDATDENKVVTVAFKVLDKDKFQIAGNAYSLKTLRDRIESFDAASSMAYDSKLMGTSFLITAVVLGIFGLLPFFFAFLGIGGISLAGGLYHQSQANELKELIQKEAQTDCTVRNYLTQRIDSLSAQIKSGSDEIWNLSDDLENLSAQVMYSNEELAAQSLPSKAILLEQLKKTKKNLKIKTRELTELQSELAKFQGFLPEYTSVFTDLGQDEITLIL